MEGVVKSFHMFVRGSQKCSMYSRGSAIFFTITETFIPPPPPAIIVDNSLGCLISELYKLKFPTTINSQQVRSITSCICLLSAVHCDSNQIIYFVLLYN